MSLLETPSDDDLNKFLLGTLGAERAEAVRVWLDADPGRAARLDRLAPRDPFVSALTDRTPSDAVPAESVERVLSRVSEALRSATGADETSDLSDQGNTTHTGGGAPTEPDPAWPPPRLGAYRVVREIGRGGMGVVLEVADDALDRRVAAKVLNPDLARRADATARFLREARTAAAVEHENVVPILHVGVEGGAPYIVMPLLKGEPLDKRIRREGALPVADVVRIGREIAAGLGAAHTKGRIHRDMKPANVWLDAGTGRARVLDFGLARSGDGTDALTESGALLGTPAYMSPEQIDGLPTDARSDLFALGAILYECSTGHRAFPGTTTTAILKAVATHTPTPPAAVNPAVPPDLSALIVRLLSKDAAGRPGSAAEVGAALAGESETATWVDRAARRPVPNRRRAAWAGGAALAALVAAGVWLGTRSHQPEVANDTPQNESPSRTADAGTSGPPPGAGAGGATAPNKSAERGIFAEVRYRGKVDVQLARTKDDPLMRLNMAGALPMCRLDQFRIVCALNDPAYLYVVMVDPGHDVTGVYPWDPEKDDWRGTRPVPEKQVAKLTLPEDGKRYRAPTAKPGVATVVMLASPTPLDVSDDVVKGWFEALPELALPANGNSAAVWFENFTEVNEPDRLRTFEKVGADDPFAQWQRQLKTAVGDKVKFQAAVSFARTGTPK